MKKMKNILAGLWLSLFVLLVCFCFVKAVSAQKNFPKIKPGKVYQQSGVRITSPNQADWQMVKSEKLETVFVITKADGKFKAFVKTMKVDIYENVEDLLENLEKQKQAEINKLDRDSIHYNRTNFKDTPCLQYDGIFRNSADTVLNYKYFNMSGYFCRHPNDKRVIIQLEFSSYSNSRGFSESEIKLSKTFFEKIIFSKVLK